MLGMGWFPDQPGGLNRYFRCLHHALVVAGERPSAVVLGPALHPPPSLTVAAQAASPLPLRLVRFAGSARRAAKGADLLDAHFALHALLPLLLPTLRRMRLVVHFQGPWAAESASVGQPPWRVWLKRTLEGAVYRRADACVVLSPAFGRILVENYRVSPWRIHRLVPGVRLDEFSPASRVTAKSWFGIEPDRWVVLAVRRLVPRMGVEVLLRAWSEFTAARPGALLLVAGDGPERAGLEVLARRLGIDEDVRFLGRVDERDLVEAYRAADVSVVPSLALEGFGLVTLESLACGTPVVVSDVAGLADVPAQLDPTSVVPSSDVSALATRLLDAASGSAPLSSGAECRRFAQAFSWAAVAERHVKLYRQVSSPTSRPIRVVYLDHVAQLSGGELALLRLLPAMEEVHAHVILAEDGPLVSRLLRAGISVEVLPMGERGRALRKARVGPGIPAASAIETLIYVVRLARRLRALEPDVVHTNSLKAALYGGLAARLAHTLVLWHLRDRIDPDYLPRPAVRLVRSMARHVPHGVIANSRATLKTLGPPPSDDRPWTVVPSPVDIYRRTERASPQSGPFRVGMVSRLAPWKGQHVFLQAFAQAFGGQGEKASAILTGAALFGEECYEAELRELARRLGIGEQVEFHGHCDDVGSELALLDVFVHASVTPEPFGQVVVEAMAAGLAVVAAGAGGPAEIISDDVDGVLVPPGDVEALASVLLRLAGNPDLRTRLGEQARRDLHRFGPEPVAAKVTEHYRTLLRRRPAGPTFQ